MRLKYLDVLKAIAIIAVILYHSGFAPYGYYGVELFLVINGYLITNSLNRKFFSSGTSIGSGKSRFRSILTDYLGFEGSKVIRLLPVLLISGIVCMVVGYFTMLPDDYENLSESVIATNVFCNNILAAITTKNYWDVVNEYKPLMHTWYVGLLMQLYIVYPFLFILAKLDKKNTHKTLLALVSLSALVSFLIYLRTDNVAHRFYFLPFRFFEFAIGGIVALLWKPKSNTKSFYGAFVFLCYAMLLALMVIDIPFLSSKIKLVLVVLLAGVLVSSGSTLENRITGNVFLSRIGAASYSIFVWHQILLAFYRYTYSSHFTVLSYSLLLLFVSFLSWLTYSFVEQKTSSWLKDKHSKILFVLLVIATWGGLNSFAGFIYKRGGVVRDIPELEIKKGNVVDHSAYNDRIYQADRPFCSSKRHWLIIGDSFGRDFANVVLESQIADSVEVSYIYVNDFKKAAYSDRITKAERVFFSSLGMSESDIQEAEKVCRSNGFDTSKFFIVGTKNFGESNGQIYVKRNDPDYYNLRVKMEDGYLMANEQLKTAFSGRYIDLISLVIGEDDTVPVFTPDHYYISQDCRHLCRNGAIYFSRLINWDIFFDDVEKHISL